MRNDPPDTVPTAAAMRWLFPVVILLGGIVVAQHSTWTQLAQTQQGQVISDFQILYVAGIGLAHGADIHDPFVMDRLGQQVGRASTPFCAYNPLVVRAFGLFEGVTFHEAFALWRGVSVVLLLAAAVLLAWALSREGLRPALGATLALAVITLNDGTWTNLFWNQMNIVALVAILAALVAAQAGRPWLEGCLLALAIAAKTSPVLIVLVSLAAGRWKTAVAAGLLGLALFEASVLTSGWEVHDSYVTEVLPRLGYAPDLPAGMAFNNSLSATNLAPNGVLTRARYRDGLPIDDPAAAWVVTGFVLLGLAIAVRRARGDVLRQYAAAVTAMFLVSSVTWPHHLVWLAIPVGWLGAAAWRRRCHAGVLASGLIATLVLFLPMYSFAPGQGRGADMTGVSSAGEEQDMRLRTGALAVLFVLTVVARPAGQQPQQLTPRSA